MKRIFSLFLVLAALTAALLVFPACGDKPDTSTHRVAIEVQDFGTIELELYPNKAPITVANFEKLVKEGFYDGLTFHRIVKDFMIQGGDPSDKEGDETGGSDKTIKGEFSQNGFARNDIKHERGVISMARSSSNDSASSQFFIVHKDSFSLDGNYAAFGRVTSGMDIVDAIANVKVKDNGSGETSTPVKLVVITRMYMIED